MNKIEAQQLLREMHDLAKQAQGQSHQTGSAEQAGKFGDVLIQQIDKVNEANQVATDLKDRFVLGDPNVSLPQAMIASQRSSLYTTFLTEARNKVINAYNEIMNMSV